MEKTFLEFGSINKITGEKNIYDIKFDNIAYDWFMLARYANDLITLKNMHSQIDTLSEEAIFSLYNKNMHHLTDASKDFYKILALSVVQKSKKFESSLSFYEFGQTIYGCIEGMEFYLKFLKNKKLDFPEIDLKQVKWFGTDISELFNQLSILFHPDYKVKTSKTYLQEWGNIDVFFAKGVTLLYGIKSAKGLFDLLNNFSFATFDYSLNLGKTEVVTIGTGKKIKYLSLKSFQNEIRKTNKELYVQPNESMYIEGKNRIRFEAIYSTEEQINNFISLDKKIKKSLFSEYKIKSYAQGFLNFQKVKNINTEWIPLKIFVNNL